MASIAVVTRHRDMRTLAGYIRRATLFDDAANEDFGLVCAIRVVRTRGLKVH